MPILVWYSCVLQGERDNELITVSRLILMNLTEDDAGEYVCLVGTSSGSDETFAYLEVNPAPGEKGGYDYPGTLLCNSCSPFSPQQMDKAPNCSLLLSEYICLSGQSYGGCHMDMSYGHLPCWIPNKSTLFQLHR